MKIRLLIFFALLVPVLVHANAFDVRGNAIARRFYLGAEASIAGHVEEGLDKSKGEYSVNYAALGGFLSAEYHLETVYFRGGVGLMRLTGLRVNGKSISMTEREQWHVPVFAHAFYRLTDLVAIGAGLTHLTETTMYLNGSQVPNSSYNQLFLDGALQLRPRLSQNLNLVATAIIGLNLIPGRQHTYSIGDLLHLRFQAQLGIVYAVF